MRHYKICNKSSAGGYEVPTQRGISRGVGLRPNRTAAGMSYTNARHRDRLRFYVETPNGILHLVVKGTNDPLARGMWMYRKTVKIVRCPCCRAQINVLQLNEAGKRRLDAARRRASWPVKVNPFFLHC